MHDMKHEKSLHGKAALVTGVGRLSGIGAALCQSLAESGADVFFTYWNPYDQKVHPRDPQFDPAAFTYDLKLQGVRAAYVEADLSDSGIPETLFFQA